MEAINIGGAFTSLLSGMPVRRKPARSGALRNTGAPVLRNSIEAGTFEESFFTLPAAGELHKIYATAKRAVDEANRLRRVARSGERTLTVAERILLGLTEKGLRVLEELLTLARLNKGQVYPSYEYLMDRTSIGRATITRALATLERLGFVIRQRRFKRVAGEGAGPRYHQTSNAYRMQLPQRLVTLVPRWLRPAPIPADLEQHHLEQIGETKAMLATLSCKEFAEATVGGALGKILARLGAGVDRAEREAHNETQPLLESIR